MALLLSHTMASHGQHFLEFGGSAVTTEFDGSLQFRLDSRIPHLSVSGEFSEHTARQVRYALVGTVGAERPFYHRYPWVVLDVRMIGDWAPGAAEFVQALRKRLNGLGGELFVVTTKDIPVVASVPRHDSAEAAVDAARAARAAHRARLLQA